MTDKHDLNRRKFLRYLLALPAAGAALTLSGCVPQATAPAAIATVSSATPAQATAEPNNTPTVAAPATSTIAAPTAAPAAPPTAAPTTVPATAAAQPVGTNRAPAGENNMNEIQYTTPSGNTGYVYVSDFVMNNPNTKVPLVLMMCGTGGDPRRDAQVYMITTKRAIQA